MYWIEATQAINHVGLDGVLHLFNLKPPPPCARGGRSRLPSALADGCDPKAGCSAGYPRAYVRLRGRIPINDMGPLLNAPAHLPLRGRELFFLGNSK